MKTKFLSATLGLFMAAALPAAPLTQTTAVHTKPDASSPTLTYLPAGTDPVAAAGTVSDSPAGWMAVELPGPLQGYAESKQFTKGLDLKPGTPIYAAPDAKSAVVATADVGDKTTITGLHGRWNQISLERKAIGYINVGGAPGYVPPIATTPASSAQPSAPATAPVSPIAYGMAGPGQPAPTVNLGDSASALPRQFAGVFVSTRSLLRPRRPYDWALNDNAGKRFAYLDISKLLLTEQIDKYVGHWVVVFGAHTPTADGKDIVIHVESLQLK